MGDGSMRRRRHFYAGVGLDVRQMFKVLALVLVAGGICLAAASALRLKPLLEQMAVSRVSNSVTRVVSDAVDAAIQSGTIRYQDLISFEKDQEGRVTALHSNMAEFNRLQSEILDEVLQQLGEVSSRQLSIPIGNLTGSALLAGRGPRIRVRLESLGSSTARFENEFISAGINQTKHQIVLYIDVYVTILLPGITTATKVSNAVTVAETIIVGSVPQSYTYFSTAPEDDQEDVKDHILNKG